MRHGQTPLNKLKKVNGQIDEPLASEGIEETKAALSLIPKTIVQIYTSSLLRAKQTAEIISSAFDIPVSMHDELAEIHMGSLAGKSWEEMENGLELKKKHRTVQFNYRSYGGESVADVKKRLLPFLKKIKKKHKDNEVLLLTHGGMIRLINMLEKGEAVYETEKHVSPITVDLSKIIKNL